jgi:asparagine synthase (glutamine-hydrolysing)
MPPAGWNAVARAASAVLPAAGRYREPGEKLQKIAMAYRHGDAAGMYRSLMSAGLQDARPFVANARPLRDAIETAFAYPAALGTIERMMWADQSEYLADDLLAKVDRVSMAVSLEVRAPLVDHGVAEFAWSLPRRFKVRDGETKWILRQLLYKRVPRALVERPKMGFSVPIAHWLRGALRPWAEDMFAGLDRTPVLGLDVEATQRYWRDFTSGGRSSTALGVWALLNLVAWGRRWGQ